MKHLCYNHFILPQRNYYEKANCYHIGYWCAHCHRLGSCPLAQKQRD
ncbi:hypothetical protein HH_0218 [Helicobacter hepaticus ATCC 51449]|uniref:Uncharacterized protein n=1 Tax=Helicobacter hepaticus (strain ATCC 51449 / 3B1) TaxID=235279 RepID=Q7VJM5_HELHP|nr:hypothetical protein HH_0218 [Helicobacter hepaticus ATCC 51449]